MDFKGVYTALITPFTEYNTVDYASLERLVDFQIESGIDGLVPCGTTGESPTLSHEEHDRVISQTIKFASGKVPVIAGTGSNATSEAIRLSQHAQDAGVDAVLLVNPYYNKPTQMGLYLHFKAIAESVSVPCILYNIKGRTGVNLETETLMRLADECRNIVAVKEASGDLVQIEDVIRRRREGFSVLQGMTTSHLMSSEGEETGSSLLRLIYFLPRWRGSYTAPWTGIMRRQSVSTHGSPRSSKPVSLRQIPFP